MRRESHVRFCERLEVQPLGPTYHRQHPWQRGSNENTNGLLRQYFPKSIDLSVYSQARLNAVQGGSMNALEKHYTSTHRLSDFVKPLHRAVESATQGGRWLVS